METLSFTLGVLSVVIAAFVAVIVWGIVKVVKQGKQINSLNKLIDDLGQSQWRMRDEDSRNQREREQYHERHLEKQFEDIKREISENHQELHSRIDSEVQDLHTTINDQVTDSITQSKSHTDSRIDKLIDAYFEYGELNKKKQIIKG